MATNSIRISEQFGFMEGMYTENIALKVTDSIVKAVN
jgi:hypothetical protein